jgi:hypothetical protein
VISILNRTQGDSSESAGVILAAVRCMARKMGIATLACGLPLGGEECTRCRCISEIFIEPVHVCTACRSTLALNAAVESLKTSKVALDSGPMTSRFALLMPSVAVGITHEYQIETKSFRVCTVVKQDLSSSNYILYVVCKYDDMCNTEQTMILDVVINVASHIRWAGGAVRRGRGPPAFT